MRVHTLVSLRSLVFLLVPVVLSLATVSLAETVAPTVRHVRTFDDRSPEFDGLQGIAFSPERELLYLLSKPDTNLDEIHLSLLNLAEDVVNTQVIESAADSVNATINNESGHLLLLENQDVLIEIDTDAAGHLQTENIELIQIESWGLRNPQGLAYDVAQERLLILDKPVLHGEGVRIVQIREEGLGFADLGEDRIERVELNEEQFRHVRGLAIHPVTGHIFLLDPLNKRLIEVRDDGEFVAEHGLSGLELAHPAALVIAPSGDQTDDPEKRNLYLIDSGDSDEGTAGAGNGLQLFLPLFSGANTEANGEANATSLTPTSQRGRVLELDLDPAEVVQAAQRKRAASLIRSTKTSRYSPPSPDAAGVTYLSNSNRLLISDSEVNEMSIFRNVNLFETRLNGTLVAKGVTTRFSNEPTGVAYNSNNGHLWVSDDDNDRIYDLAKGGDGRFGTNDDGISSFSTRSFGSNDPEGVTYAPDLNELFIIDGVNAEVYRIKPGANNRFGDGDDRITHFDTKGKGVRDPEGIAYNGARGTLYVVGKPKARVLEMTLTGSVVEEHDLSVASSQLVKPAGLTYSPASQNSSNRSLYVVDRGLDNDSAPGENDGQLFEFSLGSSGSVPNQPPTVNAGPNQTITRPASATLNGSATDDGQINPLTTSWSKASGPGSVTFADANSPNTTVTFGSAGTYVLRLTANDGEFNISDTLRVTVNAGGGSGGGGSSGTIEVRVSTSQDDAEERASGSVRLTSSDLELVNDRGRRQTVGMRFNGINVPRGASITHAYIQFQVDEPDAGSVSLTIRGEATNSAQAFNSTSHNLSSRATTNAAVNWSPPAWNTVGAAGQNQRTPNLAAIIQEIIKRNGWNSGNSLVILISGSGERTAESYNGNSNAAPLLHIEYGGGSGGGSGGGGNTNQAPTVSAGPDQSLILPANANLNGTVNDDGLPSGRLTASWTKVSGPGNVTFGNSGAVDTSASFSVPGTYVLQLTASDTALNASDSTRIVVSSAGGTGTVERRISAASDDAEEAVVDGRISLSSTDLELTDNRGLQTIGMRFNQIDVPPGATITRAYIQFQVDEKSSVATSLTLRGEASANAQTFTTVRRNISSRATTSAAVSWSPPAWNTVGEAGTSQQTPDISAIVQEIVRLGGWSSGNSLAIIVTGSGQRTAESFNGTAAAAPLLHVEYR